MDSFFDQVAPRWDDLRRTLFDDRLRDRVVGAANVGPGSSAVDVGAGTGFLTQGLLDVGAKVIAVDASAGMVAELKKKFGPRIDARLGDGQRLPLEDRSADAVVANMFLHHAEEPAHAVREMARVLRPGGRFVLADMDRHGHRWLAEEHHDRWLGFERAEVAGWMREAGLQDVQVGASTESCCATSACGETARVTVFLATGRRP